MRKNKMMRAASVLLVAVLLTTCAISGTFAKYTTTATGSDTARVARWGFKTTTLAIDLFDGRYDNVVAMKDGENVIAPGTSKTTTINLVPDTQSAPEVAYKFDVSVKIDGDEDVYGKLKWSLNGTQYDSFAAFKAAVEKLSQARIGPNKLPDTTDIVVKWEWPFESGNNSQDTYLGNKQKLDEITVTFSFTATQLD